MPVGIMSNQGVRTYALVAFCVILIDVQSNSRPSPQPECNLISSRCIVSSVIVIVINITLCVCGNGERSFVQIAHLFTYWSYFRTSRLHPLFFVELEERHHKYALWRHAHRVCWSVGIHGHLHTSNNWFVQICCSWNILSTLFSDQRLLSLAVVGTIQTCALSVEPSAFINMFPFFVRLPFSDSYYYTRRLNMTEGCDGSLFFVIFCRKCPIKASNDLGRTDGCHVEGRADVFLGKTYSSTH